VQRLMEVVLESKRGDVGLKLLPFVDTPGLAYNYLVRFEDGTDEVIREEMVPVFVDAKHHDPQQRFGERIVQGDSVKGTPATEHVRSLIENQSQLRSAADRYISQRIEELRTELSKRRREETQQELDNLEEYAAAERERIEEFIADYERKAEAGSDMDIAIRGQRERLNKLEQRIETRRQELERKAQVISLAPEVENLCLALPV
jgi:putative cell wall-binding protein